MWGNAATAPSLLGHEVGAGTRQLLAARQPQAATARIFGGNVTHYVMPEQLPIPEILLYCG
jgi:hypothetical protein